MSKASDICSTAAKIVGGERGTNYGDKLENHNNIARLWNAYMLSRPLPDTLLNAEDVALMMLLLKIARAGSGYVEDNYVDMAGYAGCAGAIAHELREMNKDVK